MCYSTRIQWCSLITLLTIAALPAQSQVTQQFSAELTSDAVGPVTADPDGSGTVQLTISIEAAELCHEIQVENIQPPFAAHLHQGVLGRVGPVQLDLEAPVDGTASGCQSADRDLLRGIVENPATFYVDLHNPEYPGATLRGQIGDTTAVE